VNIVAFDEEGRSDTQRMGVCQSWHSSPSAQLRLALFPKMLFPL